jgi:hypothetical protein
MSRNNNTIVSPTSVSDDQSIKAGRLGLARKVAVAISFALLVIYALSWVSAAQSTHGFDEMVRWTDFKSTLTGAIVIHDGNGPRLYDLSAQLDAQNRVLSPYIDPIEMDSLLPYNHLPFEALLVAPLIGLAFTQIFTLWTLLMAVAFGLALWTLYRALHVSSSYLPLFVLAACSYQPVFRSFILGQNSPLVLLGLCLLFAFSRKGNEPGAGASLLLVALKPQILPVVLLFLVLRGRWKTLATFVGLLAGLCIAAMTVLGPGWIFDYARLLLGVANWGNVAAIDPAIMHNWRGFATNLFGDIAPGLVTPLFIALSALSVGLLVYAWWVNRSDRAQHLDLAHERDDLLWSLVGIVAVLTSLHLNPHDLTLLIFPAWILAAYAVSGKWGQRTSRIWLSIIWAGYGIVPLTFLLGSPDYPAIAAVPDICIIAFAMIQILRQTTVRGVSTAAQQIAS